MSGRRPAFNDDTTIAEDVLDSQPKAPTITCQEYQLNPKALRLPSICTEIRLRTFTSLTTYFRPIHPSADDPASRVTLAHMYARLERCYLSGRRYAVSIHPYIHHASLVQQLDLFKFIQGFHVTMRSDIVFSSISNSYIFRA